MRLEVGCWEESCLQLVGYLDFCMSLADCMKEAEDYCTWVGA